MVEITLQPDMPRQRTVYQWLERHEDFAQMYARAREKQGHTIADRASHMALRGIGSDDPAARRVQLDAIKWAASKLAPKVYGDKLDLNHGGQEGNALTINIVRFEDK